MSLEEIKEFQDAVGRKNEKGEYDDFIQLFGFTSCSLSKDEALKFAW